METLFGNMGTFPESEQPSRFLSKSPTAKSNAQKQSQSAVKNNAQKHRQTHKYRSDVKFEMPAGIVPDIKV
jgi:hypothetical protein